MKYVTIGRKYNPGKVALVQCLKNCDLKNIEIKDECFLLIYLYSGALTFQVGDGIIEVKAPAFICFDESRDPKLIANKHAGYFGIFFHPQFLNVNMTFEFIHAKNYSDIATNHDMFLLRPFTDKHYVVQVSSSYIEMLQNSCSYMQRELEEQRDWYWSCRGRSYFMEIMIALERMYGLIGYGEKETDRAVDTAPTVLNPKLKDAIIFIESKYMEDINLKSICDATGLNHTTLTALFRDELGVTAVEYLMQHRIKLAKKQLAFTEVAIKDISKRCGFKTVQHFSRVFKTCTDYTPADFRRVSIQRRKDEIKKK